MSANLKIDYARFFEVFPPPFTQGVYDATLGPFTEFPVGLLELRTVDGAVGWGIGPVGPVSRELLRNAYLPPLFEATVNSDDVGAFWRASLARSRNLGPGLTNNVLSAIDTALWDLAAKYAHTPLARLLGGSRMEVPVYGSNGWVNYDLPKLVETMTGLVGRGFGVVKMKVGVRGGSDVAEDVRRVKEVRGAIGPAVGLAVDANQVWGVAAALEFARGVAEEGIMWLEEPVPAHAFKRYAELAAQSPVPLAAGESLWSCDSFESVTESVKFLQPVPHTLGGISGYVQLARLAAARSVPLASGGHSHLTCSLVAAAPTGLTTEYLVPFMDRFAEVWAESATLEDGRLRIPDRPGHGLEPDMSYVEKHARRRPLVFRRNGARV